MMMAEIAVKPARSRLSPGRADRNTRIGLIACSLWRFDFRTMAQAESKKNARLPDATCGKICGAVMTSAIGA
jgi:hypothetical protein